MTASILSNGRLRGAFGLLGGGDGAPGINRVIRASDGRAEELAHIGSAEMLPGDLFEIHTPGGGGFGQA
jgi:5-oxoprolinase (ATP-hydrolysing)